ncbi:uncharacterized protein LOC144098315 isoform X1 [Amblyomma americanum]
MAQATSAMSADSEGGQLFSDKADVVRNERGGPSARHGGRRFVLLRRRHSRHWWRCALKNCPSKLITDEYGDEHLVFKTAEHNEEEHAKATRGRRRSEAVYRNQPVQQIGDYRYVEEPSDGNDRCWRCEFVSCPGRCRTDRDLRVTAGPTQHLQEVHTKRDQPFAACNSADAFTAAQLDSTNIDRADIERDTQGTSRSVHAHQIQEQEQKYCQKKQKLHHEEAPRQGGRQPHDHRSRSPVEWQSSTEAIIADVASGQLVSEQEPSSSPSTQAATHDVSEAPRCIGKQKTQRSGISDLTGQGMRADVGGSKQETNGKMPAHQKQGQVQTERDKKRKQHEAAQPEKLAEQQWDHHFSSPVGKQSAVCLSNADPHVSPNRLVKQAPPSTSLRVSVVTHGTGGIRSFNDAKKKQQSGPAHAEFLGKFAGGGLRLDSHHKEPLPHASPPKWCEADVNKENDTESYDCEEGNAFESHDDCSTVSMESDDNNADKGSTSGPEATANNAGEDVEVRTCEKAEDESKTGGTYFGTRPHASADSLLKADQKAAQVSANCESKYGDSGEKNKSGTIATLEAETPKNGGDKRPRKSSHRLFSNPREPAASSSHGWQLSHRGSATCDSRERELRAAILIRMRHLLEAETQLAHQERRNEAMRAMLIEEQLIGTLP